MARGIQEDFGFPSTLRFPTTVQAMLSSEENAVFAMLGALECLRGGNTTLLEIGTRVPDYARLVSARQGMSNRSWWTGAGGCAIGGC